MRLLPGLAPATFILLTTLVCALPWGGAGELRVVLPLLPYAVIHRCVERWGEATPDWLVFVAGFATDVVGQGPLGFWSLIYLSGYTMVRSATAAGNRGPLRAILLFALTVACLALMQWSVASIYYMRAVEIAPLAVAAGVAYGLYLLLMIVLPATRPAPARVNARLERGP